MERVTVTVRDWDAAETLRTPEEIAAYLEAAVEDEEDTRYLRKALGNVARAISMHDIALRAGVTYHSLYKSLSENGNPSLETVFQVLKAIGVEMHFGAKKRERDFEHA